MPYRFIDDACRTCAIAVRSLALDDEGRTCRGRAQSGDWRTRYGSTPIPRQTRRYYAAYRRLMTITRRPELTLHMLLEPGTMIAFDNRRVLHGRDAFDPTTGERWLRGFYIDRTDIDSRLRCL